LVDPSRRRRYRQHQRPRRVFEAKLVQNSLLKSFTAADQNMSSSPQPIKNDKSPPVVPIGSGTFASASDPADDNASHPTKGDRPAGRKSRLREKHRLRRQQERELKRAEAAKAESTAAAKQNQAELEEKEKRHRPSPMERSMIFFMKMHD